MKKFLALVLALCMALAALPALAETEAPKGPAGTWYVNMLGLTAMVFDLREDGTCLLTLVSDEEEDKQKEGTWAESEGTVALTVVNDETGEAATALTLAWDGETLSFSEESMAEMSSGESASEGMPAGFITITREPGELTAAEWEAYQNNGTIPEGKTEDDMTAFQAKLLLAFLSMLGSEDSAGDSAGDSSGEQADPEAAPSSDPSATILDSNCFRREPSYGGPEMYYLARVKNETEVPLYITGGKLVLKDKDGNSVGEENYYDTVGSRYLEPGEVTFVSMAAKISEGAEVDSFEFSLESGPKGYYTKDRTIEVAAASLELALDSEYNYDNYVWATITNNTGAPLEDITVVYAVSDEEGNLLDIDSSTFYSIILETDSTIRVKCSLNSSSIAYCKANGITPALVEAYAWVKGE